MNGNKGNPGVEFFRKPYQVIGAGEQSLNQHPEQADENGQLDDERPQAAHRADAGLPVEPHGLLRGPRPVAAVALLNLPHFGLQRRHGPHLADLLESKGKSNQPD
jgi:hypothetical protein